MRLRAAEGSPRQVWIVNHYGTPPDQPSLTRHYDLARVLVRHGHRVTIFASSLSHVTGRDERIRGHGLWRRESYDGVTFVWIKTLPAYRGNNWRRKANMLSYLVGFLVVQTRFPRPDSCIGVTVHPFAAFGAWVAARLRGAQYVYEVGDLWPQTLVDLGAIREGSPGERLLRAMEAFCVRHADVVVTLLPGIADYLQSRGLPTHHLVYIPNGADLHAFPAVPAASGPSVADSSDHERDPASGTSAPDAAPLPPVPDSVRTVLEAARRFRSEGRCVIGYTGSMGQVNHLEVAVDAAISAEHAASGRVGVLIVGDGPDRPQLEHLADGQAALCVLPGVPKAHVSTVLQACDATLVHVTRTPVLRFGISFNKLFDYMAASKPVIFACASGYDPVAQVGAGITCSPDDPDALARAMLSMAGLPRAVRSEMGAAGRSYVETDHDVERLGERLESVILG